MVLKESGEMYLETIYVLRKEKAFVRAIDVGAELGYSKPSVSRAMGILRDGGYIKVAEDGGITLTKAGLEVAERIRVHGEITLDSRSDIDALFRMTPYFYHTPTEGMNRLSQCESLTTPISFVIIAYKKAP